MKVRLDRYREAGRKTARAWNANDMRTARHHRQWFRDMMHREDRRDRDAIFVAFDSGFDEVRKTRHNPPPSATAQEF